MKRLMIFHQALAPYRIDFFNQLAETFDAELVLFDTNLVNQKFDQTSLVGKLHCKVSYLLNGFRWKDRYFRTGAIRRIWKFRPDVVLGCEYSMQTLAVAFYRLVFRVRFKLYTMTDDNVFQFKARKGLKAILRWCFVRMLDGIIVTNEDTKIAYSEITPAHSKIRYSVIPILHAEEKMRADANRIMDFGIRWRSSLMLKDEKKIVLFVGRLDPVKNVKWLIEQFDSQSGHLMSKTILVLVGSGTQEVELRDFCKANGLSNVVFVGRKEGDELYGIMSAADALVLPSVFEPYGAVVGEALQWGTPCLVSDCVGASSLIDIDNGAVFKTNDGRDFIFKLMQVLKLPVDHKRTLLRQNLRTAVADFVRVAYE